MDLVITRRTRLRAPAGDPDLRFVHPVLTHPRCSSPFRWRGSTPPFEQFIETMFEGVLFCCVVLTRRGGVPIGVVFLSGANLRDQHAFISVAAEPQIHSTGAVIEAVFGSIEYIFRQWPLHKLYADTDEVALRQFKSVVGRYMTIEGTFHDHLFRDGRRVAVHRLALYRGTWQAERVRAVRALRIEMPSPGGATQP